MFEALRVHIANYVDLSDEQFRRCSMVFFPRNVRKKDFLLREGEICRHIAFVTGGCLRSYSVDTDGGEHVVQFAVSGWWISDLYSFLTGEPSSTAIDALEDSELLLCEKAPFEGLCSAIPGFERFFRMLLQNNYIASHRRIADTLGLSAQERYLGFLKTYPEISSRIPQHHIASFLGVTPEALSRIRRRISGKKRPNS